MVYKKYYLIPIIILLLVINIFCLESLCRNQANRNQQIIYKKESDMYRAMPIEYIKKVKRPDRYQLHFNEINKMVLNDIKCFPVEKSYMNQIYYENSWGNERTYGGDRIHEGVDIMYENNKPGEIPLVSVCDGTVVRMGWLNLGGYRIGILSESGIYFYYAHLESYAIDLKEGDIVYAGQFIGYMGDSGYGEEGTTGMFDTHLHIGIYYYDDNKNEVSINPYEFIKLLDFR